MRGFAESDRLFGWTRSFVGVDRAEFVAERDELSFQPVLLIDVSRFPGVEALTVPLDEGLEGLRHSFPPSLIGGLVTQLSHFCIVAHGFEVSRPIVNA